MDTDVLVVGGGPTGLMLANQLARRGVKVEIIDRHAGPATQTRALAVQARTLEIYAALGIADRALELGKRATGASIWAQGRQMARIPLGDMGGNITSYPFVFILGQDDNERIMGEKLHEFGVSVDWNTELVDFTQDADGVTATLKTPEGGSRTVRAAYLAGCDGAHSAVRRLSAIDFPGAPYEHAFFVADVEMTGTMAQEEVNIYFWHSGFHLLFPLRDKGHWRIVGIVPPELRGSGTLDFDAILPSLGKQAGGALSIAKCSWFSTYRIHHRAAEKFGDRRAFLLGDAAHIHSPVGGQGMNTGLQDAYNLAWKLALAVTGKADARLLDSYDAERLPVARRLLATTDRAFKLIVSDDWMAGLLRTKVIARIAAFAMSCERIRTLAFRTVSQTGINYRNGPLAMTSGDLPSTAPQSGDRFPWMQLTFAEGGPVEDSFRRLDDTRFHLVAIGQAAPGGLEAAFGSVLKVWSMPATPGNTAALGRKGIPGKAFYLIRPDGHVGLCGATAEADVIARYLTETIGLRHTRNMM